MKTSEMFDLTDRVAIITGGGRGLGLQIAEGLSEMGAAVLLCSRNGDRCSEAARKIERQGGRALGCACNVTLPDDIDRLIDTTLRHLGRIDILVNNAATAWGAPVEGMPLDKWNHVIQTNLTGTFLCSQHIGRTMIEQQSGTIINIASIAAFRGANPELMQASAYSASKAALIHLTKELACGWARHNIRVNAIAPGWFPTEMSGWTLDHFGEQIRQSIPLKRFGGADDLKGVAVFLASEASRFITGHVLVADGGMTAW